MYNRYVYKMGYIIDIGFNILKNNTDKNTVIDLVKQSECNFYYETMEINDKYDAHSIITLEFEEETQNMMDFLRNVKSTSNIYIESIYDDEQERLLYTSTYYRKKCMHKKCVKKHKEERKTRSYSETDMEILSIVSGTTA
jgi:hypothetical protein